LRLLPDEPVEIVGGGQVVRSANEPWLARLYGVSLVFGLVLFYLALPFVAAGLLMGTLGLVWLIFQAGRIPVKLVVIILAVGLGMVWAVLKSMFARMGSGSFGTAKTGEECPRLFDVLREVARRVDTTPVDEVYIAPGTQIGVHQEGRGPWGMFGTKRRVLTLGLASLRSLTVPELKSILAHEYAHFSHQDTFYSRFIHRVDLSIHTALSGMGAAGGKLNYVNPFFWFLVLYYRAYSLLSAGFSRSREYLADRMACSLYGSNVFTSSLTKVCTEGTLFDSTVYTAIGGMLNEGQAFKNMYEAFAEYRQGDASSKDREKIRHDLESEQSSFFASHPSHRERLAAAERFPPGHETDSTPAIQLFENPAALEEELTEFLTGAVNFARQQAAAAAAATAG
jgi:Zn-dependent protease with chaperone function